MKVKFMRRIISSVLAMCFAVSATGIVSAEETTTVTTETTTETTTGERVIKPAETEVEFSNAVTVGNYDTDEDYVAGIHVCKSVEELPSKIAEFYQDTDFTKYEVAFIPYIGGYFDEELVKIILGGMKHDKLYFTMESNWGENTTSPALAVHRAVAFEIDKSYNVSQYLLERYRVDFTIKDVNKVTVPDDVKIDETKADVNGDGKIDVRDLMAASQHIVSTFDYDENFDVNDDGKSNILDLMIIAKSIVE